MRYEVVEGWEQLPKGYEHRDVAGVAVDGEDRVFLICRGDHPILAYDRKGSFPPPARDRRAFCAPGAKATSRPARTASASRPTAPCGARTTATARSDSSGRTA